MYSLILRMVKFINFLWFIYILTTHHQERKQLYLHLDIWLTVHHSITFLLLPT